LDFFQWQPYCSKGKGDWIMKSLKNLRIVMMALVLMYFTFGIAFAGMTEKPMKQDNMKSDTMMEKPMKQDNMKSNEMGSKEMK
jgi:pentapeptide MXKDX repeat protein